MNEVYFPDRNCVNCGNPIPKPNPETSFTTLDKWIKKMFCCLRCEYKYKAFTDKRRKNPKGYKHSYWYKYTHNIKF